LTNKKTTKSSLETHEIEGRSVAIRRREDTEELWIDGRRRRVFLNDDGYSLHDDAYARPQKSLLEAVKVYLRKYPRGKTEER